MALHNGHDFHPLTALGLANLLATALGRGKGGIDEALRLIERPFLSEGIGQLHERIPQHFTATPLLETSVHRFVVRIALRQHVPLRTRVQNPQDGFEYPARSNRFASWAAFRNMFFRKMFPDAFPLLIAQM